MGKKLSRDDYMKSLSALHKFYIEIGKTSVPIIKTVIVKEKNSGNVVLKDDITINTVYDNTQTRINIIWEDIGYTVEEFRDFGLFGYYDCNWIPMKYSNGVLSINSPDSNKIIDVLA